MNQPRQSPGQYLEWHNRKLRVRVKVPAAARAVLGKSKLTHWLNTDSLTEANRDKAVHVLRLKAIINEALKPSAVRNDALIREALRWRASIQNEKPDADGIRWPSLLLPDAAEAVEDTEGSDRASMFHDIALGLATPLGTHFDAWVAAKSFKPRTVMDHRRALERLSEWLRREHLPMTIEAVDDRQASRFVDERLMALSLSRKSVMKIISALSTYWAWMVRRRYIDHNPWLGKAPEKERERDRGEVHPTDERDERAFNADEIVSMFAQAPDAEIFDGMALGALTGARLEAVFRLRVKDVQDGAFWFQPFKGEKRGRWVPVHPDLAAVVARRVADKAPDEFLMHEAGAPNRHGERSAAFSKRFGRFLRSTGVAVLLPGERRSKVNYHSFRRWFASQCEAAEIQEHLAARVTGHHIRTMTYGVYSRGPGLEQLRTVVESVRLPKGVNLAKAPKARTVPTRLQRKRPKR